MFKINLFDKKGADKILVIYWFAILLLVAGGIFAMVHTFYGSPYDVRELEANILANKVGNCISYSGEMNSLLFKEGVFNPEFNNIFLEECNLILEGQENEIQYFVKVNFYEVNDGANSIFEIFLGNNNLNSYCNVQEDKEYKKLVRCVEKRIYSTYNSNQYLIKILSVVRKTEQNVK